MVMESLFVPCKVGVDSREGEEAKEEEEEEEEENRKFKEERDGETTEEEVDLWGENDEKKEEESEEQQQQQQQCPLPSSKDFLQALTRWGSLKEFPDKVAQEIDSLLSLLSSSIICPAGQYVAVNVSSLRRKRLVWIICCGDSRRMIVFLIFMITYVFFSFSGRWFWNKAFDPERSYKHVLFRLSQPLLTSDTVAQVSLLPSFHYIFLEV